MSKITIRLIYQIKSKLLKIAFFAAKSQIKLNLHSFYNFKTISWSILFLLISFNSIAQFNKHSKEENLKQNPEIRSALDSLLSPIINQKDLDSLEAIQRLNEALQILKTNNSSFAKCWFYYVSSLKDAQDKQPNKAIENATLALDHFNKNEENLPIKYSLFLIKNPLLLMVSDKHDSLTNKAISYYKMQNDSLALGTLYGYKAHTYKRKGKFSLAQTYFLRALSFIKNSDDLMLKCQMFNSIASNYKTMGNLDSCIYYQDMALELGIRYNIPKVIIGMSMNKGSTLRDIGLLDSAMTLLKNTLPMSTQASDKTLLSSNLEIIGNCYIHMGNYDSAHYYLGQALEVCTEHLFFKYMIRILVSKGFLYETQDSLEQALISTLKADSIARLYNFRSHLFSCSYSIGSILKKMEEHERAEHYFLQAVESEEQSIFINSTLELADLYSKQGKLEKAKDHYLKSLAIVQREKNINNKLKVYMGLARLDLENGMINESEAWLEKAFNGNYGQLEKNSLYYELMLLSGQIALKQKKYSKSIDIFNTCLQEPTINSSLSKNILCYKGLKEAYFNSGDYKTAYQYQSLLRQKEKEKFNEEKAQQILHLQTEFESKQKDNKIQNLEQEKEIQNLTLANQEAKISKQKQSLLFIVLIAISILILSFLLFNRYRLSKKNKELSMQTRQLELEREQEQTNQELEMAQLRSDFFTNISHEFRTPLTLILGPLEKLLNKGKTEYQKDIDRIHRNAKQLLALVNETLDLSKVENGHLPLAASPVKLGSSVAKITQSFTPLAEKQQIDLELIDHSENWVVDVDENKLHKVLVNVLGNAFKHTPQGGLIQLTIDKPNSDTIAIHVKDNGRGIEKEHLPYIFDRFYQGNTQTKGTGVGLALSKQLVKLHGGNISVESEVGKGSTFSIQLPLKQKGAIEKIEVEKEVIENTTLQTSVNESTEQQNKTILIIEDNDDVRDYIKEILEPYYHLLLAANGQEGIELAERNNPDLIVSDVMMPFKDGFELTAHLKQNMVTSHIPIVLLTAKASIDSKLRGLELGADDYLGKPFHTKELIQRCKNLIQQREQLRQLFLQNPMHRVSAKQCTSLDQSFMNKALEITKANYQDEEFTVEQFCKQMALNRSSVHNKLKSLTGQSASQYIQTFRLAKAGDLLKGTNQTISTIVMDTGFSSRQAFYKAFQKYFGMTPSEYRNQNKET